jgi:predicted nucleic acid-binding protein
MLQTAFLDTNVILDYLYKRNRKVHSIVSRLLKLQKDGKIILATSVPNFAELIDKDMDICFLGWCLKKKMSSDEAVRKRWRDRRKFKDVCRRNRKKLETEIRGFINDNGIKMFSSVENHEDLYNLILGRNLGSQDALVVSIALQNDVTYFLTNDSDLFVEINDLLDAYNLSDEKSRRQFHDDVLEAI